MEEAGLGDKPVTSVSIGYTLAPRINAAGRMGQADLAAELLLTRDPGRAAALAQELCALNRSGRPLSVRFSRSVCSGWSVGPSRGIILLADEHWHQGVVGIVASRLTEKYSCPAFMVCLDQGIGKGSCRSWGGVNLFHLLTQCQDLLEGLRRATPWPPALPFGRRTSPALRAPPAAAGAGGARGRGAALSAGDRRGGPAPGAHRGGGGGPGCPGALRGGQSQAGAGAHRGPCDQRRPGGSGRHLKLRLEGRGVPLDAIFFSVDGSELGLTPGCRVDVAFYPQINDFRGVRSVQLQVVDLRHAMTRAQLEQSIYEKYRRGEPLSPQEAQSLLPTRAEFVCLWRYLERQCAGQTFLEDTLARIAQKSARSGGQSERPNHTLVCLEVMEERGLISLERQSGRVQITLHRLEHKVDLNASAILRRLREATQET